MSPKEYGVPTLEHVMQHRNELLGISESFGARNVRIFGSVVRGEADQESDIDVLVELESGRSLLDLAALQQALAELFGFRVQISTYSSLSQDVRTRILSEAIAA